MQMQMELLMHINGGGHMLIESDRPITDCRRSQLGCGILVTGACALLGQGIGEGTV